MYTRSELENSGQCHLKSIRVLPLSSMLRVESGLILIIGVASCTYPIRDFFFREIHANYTACKNFALYGTIQDIVFVGCKFHHFSFSSFFVEYQPVGRLLMLFFTKLLHGIKI